MTRAEFDKIKYHLPLKMPMKNEMVLIFKAKDALFGFYMIVRIPKNTKENIISYSFNGVEYGSIDSLLNTIGYLQNKAKLLDYKLLDRCKKATERVSFLDTAKEKRLYTISLYFSAIWGSTVR